jgi:hypothetical protein
MLRGTRIVKLHRRQRIPIDGLSEVLIPGVNDGLADDDNPREPAGPDAQLPIATRSRTPLGADRSTLSEPQTESASTSPQSASSSSTSALAAESSAPGNDTHFITLDDAWSVFFLERVVTYGSISVSTQH